MRRRRLVLFIAATAATCPFVARSQQLTTGRIPRIGILGVASPADGFRGVHAFKAGLQEHGHVEGKTYVIEHRWAHGQYELLDSLAAELVRLPVDIIYVSTTAATLAAKRATATIPIVFANVGAPVELGLAASMARPGGNSTGLTYFVSAEIVGKQMQLLKEARPQTSVVALLWNPANTTTLRSLREAQAAAGSLKLDVHVFEVRGPGDLEASFAAMTAAGVDALLVLPDPVLSEHRTVLGMLALKARLPSIFGSREDLADGCLMAYGVNRLDLIRRAAGYVDKILKGAKPGDLPVEQPTKYELIVNLNTGKALGIAIPDSILARADEVIE